MNLSEFGLVVLFTPFFLFCTYSCMSANNPSTNDEYIEVYYFKGRPDANLPCSKEFSTDEADSLGEIIIKSSNYQRIVKYVNETESVTEETPTCTKAFSVKRYIDLNGLKHGKRCSAKIFLNVTDARHTNR